MNHWYGKAHEPSGIIDEVQDYSLDPSIWNLEKLKSLAEQLKLPLPRSLAWGIMLQTLPLPDDGLGESLKTHRKFYNDLKKKLSMDPRDAIDDDPLSQNDESAWNQHFCDNELKSVILQDVVRTFPDEQYFREQEVHDLMVRVLFHWSRSHSSLGYRQGMHEVLAPLLYELYADRKYAPPDLSGVLREYLDDDYLEHDSYMLFNVVMRGLERFYTTGDVVPSSSGRMPTSTDVHNPSEVVRYLEQIREEHLTPLDPELAAHLSTCNISLELFGIRWLRLLFGRELPRSEIAPLWGFLFSEGPTLPYIPFVVVALLITMRDYLLVEEASVVLSRLMRPPRALLAARLAALALHLARPLLHPPPPPPHPPSPTTPTTPTTPPTETTLENGWWWSVPRRSTQDVPDEVSDVAEGVAEGADVARELAALALVRARLPLAAAQLRHVLRAQPRLSSDLAQPVAQILQLVSLLQCRNHELIDVETALEASEVQGSDRMLGKKHLMPVKMIGGRNTAPVKGAQVKPIAKEVPLKTFHQAECVVSDGKYPSLDPIGLRTD